jgi:hypothetical protein
LGSSEGTLFPVLYLVFDFAKAAAAAAKVIRCSLFQIEWATVTAAGADAMLLN